MISPIAFEFLGIKVYWYGISYLATFLISRSIVLKLGKKHKLLNANQVDSLINHIFIGVILGGRIGYFLFYEKFSMEIFKIWQGGMSFHGGFIGASISIIIFCLKYEKRLLIISDLCSICAPIGCFLVRIGNYINQEINGLYSNFLTQTHPVVLYEALLEGLLNFLIIIICYKKTKLKKEGILTGLFLLNYGVFRIACEFFKEDYGSFLGIQKGQILSLPIVILGIIILRKK